MAQTAIIVIGASAGGIDALTRVLGDLPPGLPAAVVIVQHRAPTRSVLVEILARKCALPVSEARDGEQFSPGHVYLARADEHLSVTSERRFAYSDGHRIGHVLSSVNPLFISSAAAFGAGAIGVVLSGSGCDGTEGVLAIKAHGGIVIAQDEATAGFFGMPGSAIASGAVDYILPIKEIGPALVRLATGTAVTEPPCDA